MKSEIIRHVISTVAIIALCVGCGHQYSSSEYEEYEKQTRKYWEQVDITERQMKRADEHADRYEQLLIKWEEQAIRQDDILTKQEDLLRKQQMPPIGE